MYVYEKRVIPIFRGVYCDYCVFEFISFSSFTYQYCICVCVKLNSTSEYCIIHKYLKERERE